MFHLPKSIWLIAVIALTSCHPDDDWTSSVWQSTREVTWMIPVTGLGDDGYNDCALQGIFRFTQERGTALTLLRPADMAEAHKLYREWLSEHTTTDSTLLILGSSKYATMARQTSVSICGKGSGILLYESSDKDMPEGISTLQISRYGVSWLAGAMSQDFDAVIIAAAPNTGTLQSSIAGFTAGHGTAHSCTVQYLADNEQGFAMPDSAYRFVYPITYESSTMLFPLLGGSANGVFRALNDNEFSMPLVIGMDVDQGGLCSRLPFSVVVHIGESLYNLLNRWASGQGLPRSIHLGIGDGATEIMLNPLFIEGLDIWKDWYAQDDYFKRLYQQYKAEALLQEEDAYEK